MAVRSTDARVSVRLVNRCSVVDSRADFRPEIGV